MIDYTEKIPNNVDLGRDRGLQRALEHWQPAYMGWWYDMGPNESHNYEVYLRTAISVEPDGWAQFGRTKHRRGYGWRSRPGRSTDPVTPKLRWVRTP